MIKSLIVLFAFFCSSSVIAQNLSDTTKTIKNLEEQIKKQSEEINDLRTNIESTNNLKISERKKRDTLALKQIDLIKKELRIRVSVTYSDNIKAHLLDGAFKNEATTLDVNNSTNPTETRINGQTMFDGLLEIADHSLMNALSADRKEKWKSVIKTVYENKMTQAILKSNPVTTFVSSVVETSGIFADNFDNRNRRSETFSPDNIRDFIDRTRRFREFYDNMKELNEKYARRLEKYSDSLFVLSLQNKAIVKAYLAALSLPHDDNDLTLDGLSVIDRKIQGKFDSIMSIADLSPSEQLEKLEETKFYKYLEVDEVINTQERFDSHEYKAQLLKILTDYKTDIKAIADTSGVSLDNFSKYMDDKIKTLENQLNPV